MIIKYCYVRVLSIGIFHTKIDGLNEQDSYAPSSETTTVVSFYFLMHKARQSQAFPNAKDKVEHGCHLLHLERPQLDVKPRGLAADSSSGVQDLCKTRVHLSQVFPAYGAVATLASHEAIVFGGHVWALEHRYSLTIVVFEALYNYRYCILQFVIVPGNPG